MHARSNNNNHLSSSQRQGSDQLYIRNRNNHHRNSNRNINSNGSVNNHKPHATSQLWAATARHAVKAQAIRHRPRMMVWGDGKKAVIQQYPDGRQEIAVPQHLTTEQLQYQFPPRSRLLKRLAMSVAEQQRLVLPELPPPSDENPLHEAPVVPPSKVPQPDQGALNEWFSQRNARDQSILDWMSQVEASQTPSPTCSASPRVESKPTSPLASPSDDHQKRRQHVMLCTNLTTSSDADALVAPDESSERHFVPRRLLAHSRRLPRPTSEALPLPSPLPPLPLPLPTHTLSHAQTVAQLKSSLARECEERREAERRLGDMSHRLEELQAELEAEKHARKDLERLNLILQRSRSRVSTSTHHPPFSSSSSAQDRRLAREQLQIKLDRALAEIAALKQTQSVSRTC